MAQVLKDEIKDKIKNAAVHVFTLKGYKNASIKEIAKEAHVSVGNVYRYYENKKDLYESVIQGVYDGVQDLMKLVEEQKNYELVYETNAMEEQVYEPMMKFVKLYRQEQNVFVMLLKGEKDQHYKETIVEFIDMLRDYFLIFWGKDKQANGLSFIEASALTNAIVFSVIDILNRVEDHELDEQLIDFVPRMIKGYFIAKRSQEE